HTLSKMRYGNPVGLKSLIHVKKVVSIPIFGLGGIKSGNLNSIFQSGAYGISLISAIFAADDIKQASSALNDLIQRALAGKQQGQ
ncbi:MAG TPA: thiamine phosphate synthase, partial [Nitrospirota bacterium]